MNSLNSNISSTYHRGTRNVFILQLMAAGLGVFWKSGRVNWESRSSPSWGDIGHGLLWGNLIYPWIKPAKDKTSSL